MTKLQLLRAVLLLLLPSALKIHILRRGGARIGKSCRIGASLIVANDLVLEDHVTIGSFNIIYRVKKCKIGRGSCIGSMNWIAGGGTGQLLIGQNSSVRRLHYIDVSGGFGMGDNSIIAGRGSIFFTHGLSPEVFDVVAPIQIGNWCYIGAAARFSPGSGVSDGTFVGLGSVVTKCHDTPYVLLAGVPAKKVKTLNPEMAYFSKPYLPLTHHPKNYTVPHDG